MAIMPTLTTDRLVLRPFSLSDAPDVQRLANAFEIADMTLLIPHPYPDGAAEVWISTHQTAFDKDESLPLAITDRHTSVFMGTIGIHFNWTHNRAEIGYWLGVPFWGNGYMSEAAAAVLRYGFVERGLQRIHAEHFARNPASGRVMQKIGMKYEGRCPAHFKKWDKYEDVILYGMLKPDWEAMQG